ncbi:MAG: helix-turn-helix domain-containing protein [Deltaproteobacteria bacterium]|nr:helix-turn-helix domain-containing protein [Deltaproteobacteria bacterium]
MQTLNTQTVKGADARVSALDGAALREFGLFLRAERELRDVALTEISSVTKVPMHLLEALEAGDAQRLPARVFVRGFVRAYGQHLGIPDTEQRFLAACEPRVTPAITPATEELPSASNGDDLDGRRRVGVTLAVIILLIIATLTLSLLWRGSAAADVRARGNVSSGHSLAAAPRHLKDTLS